jgi:hypothetical protein
MCDFAGGVLPRGELIKGVLLQLPHVNPQVLVCVMGVYVVVGAGGEGPHTDAFWGGGGAPFAHAC